MRLTPILGVVTWTAFAAGTVSGQAIPYTATVAKPEVSVFCINGNGQDNYATNLLHRGDKVRVVRDDRDGWLAIEPPVGSFSWINKRFLKESSKNTWTVVTDADAPADVLYGSSFRNAKPTVRSTRVQRGAQVVSIGPAMTSDDGLWLPILPPASEVRYIRAEAVTADGAATSPAPAVAEAQTTNSGRQDWNRAVPLVPPPQENRAVPAPQAPADPRWAEAERAEREGRMNEAYELYMRLGRDVANSDHALAMRCYNQAAALRQRNAYGSAYAPNSPDNRLRPVAAGTAGYAAAAQAAQYACTPYGTNEFVFRGRLRQAYQAIDHKPTYVLENPQGQRLAFVTEAGARLEAYLDRIVEVRGAACYRGDVRCNHVRASVVTPLQ